MKIGTLTLHLPCNYGNALQMLSLHRYLRDQGYDAEVLSHWYFERREEVTGLHQQVRSFRGAVQFLFNCLLFSGTYCQFRREAKLDKWLRTKIKWSEETGTDGDFPAKNLSHDVVIVGSDQIWNPIHKTSDFFLLPTFPERIRKIAYAASLGTNHFIEERKPLYREAVKRFEAISVRESSAEKILEQELSIKSTLVCDPTLLHTKEEWAGILGFRMPKKVRDELCMYLVTPDYRNHWREVIALARSSRKKIHFFAFQWSQFLPTFQFRHPLRMLRMAARNIAMRLMLYCAGVRLHLAATPSEFVERIARSNGLITDSFHGMMFATIFEKPCNVTIGTHGERLQMSARLRDFAADFGRSEILTPKADVLAMKEVKVTPRLTDLIKQSKEWLKEALNA